MIEGGPSDEYEQNNADWASLVTATIQAAQQRDRAEKLWQSGRRSEAMAILQKNPNVGIEYRALVDGEVVQSGSYFGKDAADFLNGISMAVHGGLLSPVTSQSGATTRHHPQEPAKPSHSKRDPCPPVPEGPSGASIDDNIRTAVNSFKDALEPKWYAGPDSGEDPLGKLAGHVLWFFNQVKDKGPWDYKYRDPAVNEGKRSKYEPFGNFNYGASGAAAGFSDGQLLRLAGHYQTDRTYARGENPGRLRSILGVGGRVPYGDEPGDQDQIRNGINYYRRKFVLKDCL